MPSRIEPVRPGESGDEEVDELLRAAEREWYGDAAFFGAMAYRPTLFKRLAATLGTFPESEEITLETLELMRLRVASLHQCTYCATVRTQAVREAVAPKESAVFGDEVDDTALTRRETLAVRLVDHMTEDPHRMTDSFFEELQTVYSEEAIVELLLFASLEVGLDRFTIALTLDTTEEGPYPTELEYPLGDPSHRDG